MRDRERYRQLQEAMESLRRTGQGHIQWVKGGKKGGHWKEAMRILRVLEDDLEPSEVPALGKLWSGGKSILLHDLTHATSGISLYPALDDCFHEGEEIFAVERMEVIGPYTSSNPGHAFYARGSSRIRFWYAHLDRHHTIGRVFQKGEKVGRVAPNAIGGGPHVHLGVNIELVAGKGKQLLHHTDYTHGAPKIGAQLERLFT